MNFFHTILKSWTHWCFPPLCACCKARSELPFLCHFCWSECVLMEKPAGGEEELTMESLPFFSACVFRHPHLFRGYPDLWSSFSILQWGDLDWPVPDCVIPMPFSQKVAQELADSIGSLYLPLGQISLLEEGQTILAIDEGRSLDRARPYLRTLAKTLPKKGFLLHLFPYEE